MYRIILKQCIDGRPFRNRRPSIYRGSYAKCSCNPKNIDALYLTVFAGIMNNRSADIRRIILDTVITVTAGLLFCLNVSTYTRNSQNLNRVVARYQRLHGLTLIRITKRRVLTCSSTFVLNLYPRKRCMFHLLIFR